MNWILILTVVLLSWQTVRGYRRGLLHILFTLFAGILMMAFVTGFTPRIASAIEENTTLDEILTQRTEQKIENVISSENGSVTVSEALQDMGINLPEKMAEQILGEDGILTEITENTGIAEKLAAGISRKIIMGAAWTAAVILGTLLLWLVSGILKSANKVPVLGSANRLIGAAAGLLSGLVIVWGVFAVIALLCSGNVGRGLSRQITDSLFLNYLYMNNPILKIF